MKCSVLSPNGSYHSQVMSTKICIIFKCYLQEYIYHLQTLFGRVLPSSAVYKSIYHLQVLSTRVLITFKCCLQECISLSSAVDQSVKVLSMKVYMSAGIHHFLVLATTVCITFKSSLQTHINHFQVL